jgi:tetraacyldisaccharide 4'-kinase
MSARTMAYHLGLRPRHRLEVPVVAVGGLSVGGAGKTPLASWIASYLVRRGRRPAVVLRGVGRDEGAVHRRLAPGAIVVEDPDRPRGGRAAVRMGADVLVLDDAFQRLDTERDVNIATIAAESARQTGVFPAGPWREPWTALRRADLLVVTRKSASPDQAHTAAAAAARFHPTLHVAIASLRVAALRRLGSTERLVPGALAGKDLLVSAGIADPGSLGAQLQHHGARVTLLPWPDHHAYRLPDVARIAAWGRAVDYVVVTEKDAVKLEPIWPIGAPAPWVAELELDWESGFGPLDHLLSHLPTLS